MNRDLGFKKRIADRKGVTKLTKFGEEEEQAEK
jgi:hypothetical protein